MGCDIHMYIEYRRKNEETETYKPHWWNFGGQMNPGRNYWAFGYLTNGSVRSTQNPKNGIDCRGLPEEIGTRTKWDAEMFITDTGDGENDTTLARALEWAKYGNKIHYNNDGTPHSVDHPDWHSHSWLSYDEYSKLLKEYKRKVKESMGIEYEAILSVMKTFNDNSCDSRVVFWFDN